MLQLVHYLLADNTRCLNLLPYSCLLNFKMEFIGTKMGVPLFEDNFGLQYNDLTLEKCGGLPFHII